MGLDNLPSPIRVLVVEDHTLFRKGLISLLQQQEGLEIVGDAEEALEGIGLARLLNPDVILMDLQMPQMNGIQAIYAIRETHPEARIIILTVSEEDEDLFLAVKAGARGYLLKNIKPDQLMQAICQVAQGEAVIPNAMASKLLTEFGRMAKQESEIPETKRKTLTPREREILKCLAKGGSNKEIAHDLNLSEHTVKIHLKNILHKLHMSSRTQAAIYAYQQGLITQPDTSRS